MIDDKHTKRVAKRLMASARQLARDTHANVALPVVLTFIYPDGTMAQKTISMAEYETTYADPDQFAELVGPPHRASERLDLSPLRRPVDLTILKEDGSVAGQITLPYRWNHLLYMPEYDCPHDAKGFALLPDNELASFIRRNMLMQQGETDEVELDTMVVGTAVIASALPVGESDGIYIPRQ
jgi:hypothetical protein